MSNTKGIRTSFTAFSAKERAGCDFFRKSDQSGYDRDSQQAHLSDFYKTDFQLYRVLSSDVSEDHMLAIDAFKEIVNDFIETDPANPILSKYIALARDFSMMISEAYPAQAKELQTLALNGANMHRFASAKYAANQANESRFSPKVA